MKAVRELLIDANSVDEKYNTQRQRINFTSYIEHNEFELALDSLIELADETEEKFTYDFWTNLEQAAVMMGLTRHQEIISIKIAGFKL